MPKALPTRRALPNSKRQTKNKITPKWHDHGPAHVAGLFRFGTAIRRVCDFTHHCERLGACHHAHYLNIQLLNKPGVLLNILEPQLRLLAHQTFH